MTKGKKKTTAKVKKAKYTVDYFIKKFTAIPANKWCRLAFTNSKGQHCAIGHCGGSIGEFTEEGMALNSLVGNKAPFINDAVHNFKFLAKRYTIKGRILWALKRIKAGLPLEQDPPKKAKPGPYDRRLKA